MYSKEVSQEEKTRGAWWIAVAKDAVLPVMNAGCPFAQHLRNTGITRQKFYDIFISEKLSPGDSFWVQPPGRSFRFSHDLMHAAPWIWRLNS